MNGIHAEEFGFKALKGGKIALNAVLVGADDTKLHQLASMFNKNVVIIAEDDFIRPKDTRHEDNVAQIRAMMETVDVYIKDIRETDEPKQEGVILCDKCFDSGTLYPGTSNVQFCDCQTGRVMREAQKGA